MCRFVIYYGPHVLLSELISKPNHSIIKQSYACKERKEGATNGDGFGVGWYSPEIDTTPCVFTSVTPAWSNHNLQRLAKKIISPLIFAHVRAASPGSSISEANCHPFEHGRFMWLHNGSVPRFPIIKRKLANLLREDVYLSILGDSDSAHAFALFLNFLADPMQFYTPEELRKAMIATIQKILELCKEAGIEEPCMMNFAVSDGETVVATRFINHPQQTPPTLYLLSGTNLNFCTGDIDLTKSPTIRRTLFSSSSEYLYTGSYAQTEKHNTSDSDSDSDNGLPQGHPCPASKLILLSSEPLTNGKRDIWTEVPKNHIVVITSDKRVFIDPIHFD